MAIVDGNKIAAGILAECKLQIADLEFKPKLKVFMVGENPASLSYIKIKKRKAESIGVEVEVRKLAESVAEQRLIEEIKTANFGENACGILVQLPLPERFDKQKVLDAVSPGLDVDCLTTVNKEKLYAGSEVPFLPPAAAAVLEILNYHKVDLKTKNVLLVGSGDLVGKPLASLLLKQNVNFKLANRFTENFPDLAKKADVIITAVGKPNLIIGDLIKDDAVVIDAGTAGSDEGEVIGDVDFESALSKAGLVTPVPGGVGPVTVAMLLRNVIRACT